LPPSALDAQSILGRLLDDETGDPIPAVSVTLLAGSRGSEIVRGALSDSLGEFFIGIVEQGRFRLKAERIGYQSVTSPAIDLLTRDTLEVELRMSVKAIPLAPLTVTSERLPLVLSLRLEAGGFIDRKSTYGWEGMGMGHFLVESDWAHRSPARIADLVREVPGVRVVGGSVRMRNITSFDPGGCVPSYYLDGNLIRLRGGSIDDLLSPFSISAVEVYPGMSKPPQFMDMGDHPCGAIVLWTG